MELVPFGDAGENSFCEATDGEFRVSCVDMVVDRWGLWRWEESLWSRGGCCGAVDGCEDVTDEVELAAGGGALPSNDSRDSLASGKGAVSVLLAPL